MHECILIFSKDPFSYEEQYLAQCSCHMGRWIIVRPEDLEFRCPLDYDKTGPYISIEDMRGGNE